MKRPLKRKKTSFELHTAIAEQALKKHPEVVLAQRIMEQAKKARKSVSMFVDQSNYYKIP